MSKQIKSKKEVVWEKMLAEVEEIVDHLGKGVDEGIKETVAAFLLHGFTTSASCEGHVAKEGERQRGLPYPWVEVYAPEPEGWGEAEGEKKEQLGQEWITKNLEQQRKMMELLKEFYKGRKTPFDARLVFYPIGVVGGFRVQSFGAELTTILTPKEQREKLALYQKEMRDFTEFLKDKYFSEEEFF